MVCVTEGNIYIGKVSVILFSYDVGRGEGILFFWGGGGGA